MNPYKALGGVPHCIAKSMAISMVLVIASQVLGHGSETINSRSIRLVLGYFSGSPSPTLVITDSMEIESIAKGLMDAMGNPSTVKIPFPAGPGYSGMSLSLDGIDSLSGFFRIYRGVIFANGITDCYVDTAKLEEYLVSRVLNSRETVHQFSNARFKEIVLDKLRKGR